ncbi:DUF2723 domain-containing protein [Pseudenhygromyxa sp. WMMC2535]|uniref:protein O-mannosyl-transferase family n=1 Tax=Pseudenhygromyxa sp. WMMC2535 TaxID=2712867 RepID=UPI001552583F|nr:DUF2723 domain-containing protein [Pseudenhygromyxa sp. WMMC2535]NVB42160.1 DUF2723 domain-containing protein [Pseudenhygromyxa sp. WMMC2535]
MGDHKAQADANTLAEDRSELLWWPTLLLATALLALALWAMPREVQAGDAGEFATVMLTGGVPHPSGYPWMRALGLISRALWALGLPPALAAALPPSLAGVAAWTILQRIAGRLCAAALGSARASWMSAALVGLVASAPLVVIHVNDSEVWGPHLLFSALFMRALIREDATPLRLGIWLGLAVSHHLTAILLIPMAIAGAWPRPGERRFARLLANGGLGLLGSAIGLAPLLSLPIGSAGGWRWGDVRSVEGFLHHVLRRDYGTFSLSLHEDSVSAVDTIARCLASLAEVFSAGLIASPWFGALVLALALAGATIAWRRSAPKDRAGASLGIGIGIGIGWMASVLAASLVFPAAQNIDPNGPFGAWILERFDLLPTLLLVPGLCLGLAALSRGLAELEALSARSQLLIRGGLGLLALVLGLAQLAAITERGRPATERAVERAAVDLLECPDPLGPAIPSAGQPIRAIVIGTDDHRSFPALYAREVLGAGEHTLYIDAQLLAHPWYRARLRERVPTLPDVDKPLRLIAEIWSDPTLDQLPIYLANVFSRPAESFPRVPEGLLWRIPLPASHPRFVAEDWSLDAVTQRHLAALDRLQVRAEDFAGLDHPRGHPWSADLWRAYVDKSRALAAQLAAAERVDALLALDARLRQLTGVGLRE